MQPVPHHGDGRDAGVVRKQQANLPLLLGRRGVARREHSLREEGPHGGVIEVKLGPLPNLHDVAEADYDADVDQAVPRGEPQGEGFVLEFEGLSAPGER